jgi:hypothetical protein
MIFQQSQDVDVEVSQEEWEAYLEVQESGDFNMLDPNARLTAGLERDVWLAIMSNYEELEDEYGGR